MHAELIAIGAELLLGEITDTNSTHIARAFRDLGVELRWISVVGDDEQLVAELVAQAAKRSPIVITTGGLGPTVDDPTRAAIARAFNTALEYRPELWEQIEARFRRFRRTPTENNKQQAYIPAGALALENPVGTAPCFIVEHPQGAVIALPGVPREMEHMLAHAVTPYLRQKFNLTGVIRAKVLRAIGIGESMVDEQVAEFERMSNPIVGLAAHAAQVDIRITAKAESEAEAEALIAPIETEIRRRLDEYIYGEGKVTIEEVLSNLLSERKHTLAVSEVGTQGALTARLATVPNAAQVFRGGEMPPAEASTTPQALAEKLRAERATDWAVGVVVTPKPDGGQHIDIAIVGPQRVVTRSFGFGSAPALVGVWAATSAFNVARLEIAGKLT